MRCLLIFSLLCVYAWALDLEFPPCEQLNPALCSSDRFKNQCPSVCGGGGGGNGGGGGGNGEGGNNGNDNNGNGQGPKNKGHEKPPKGSSTSKPTTAATEAPTDNTENDTEPPVESKTTQKSSNGGGGGGDEDQETTKKATTKKQSDNGGGSNANNKATTKRSGGGSKCDKVTPCVDADTANAGFLERCKAKGIKETCWEKCRYDVTFDELKKAMLGGKCPIAGMRDYLKCGANSNDNRYCCEKTGVLEGKRDFCFPFCNPSGETWPSQKEAMKYLPCASQMSQIMKCHWAGIES